MVFLTVLVSANALAQTKPSVAAYPLEVLVRGVSDQQVKDLQSEGRRLLGLEAQIPDRLSFDAAVVMTERKDCDTQDACLAQFAVNAKVLYALFVSVETDLKQAHVTAKGRVVRDDGVLVVPVKTVTMPVTKKGKDAVDLTVREALKALYAEFKISTLPVAKEAPKKDPDPLVKKDPDPIKKDPDITPPPPPPLVDTGAGQRSAGTALLIGGVAVAAIGVGLSSAGCGFGCSVIPVNGTVLDGELRAIQTGRGLMTAGFIAVGAGVGVAAIGAVLLASAPAPVKQVSVVPMAGGAVVQFGGSF